MDEKGSNVEQLVSVKTAAKKYDLKIATVRAWVRRNDVAGVCGKPCLVYADDLLRYLKEKGNKRLRMIYSAQVATPGATPGDRRHHGDL